MAFKIIVCAKQVPDTNVIKINPATGTLIRDGVPSILNHDDNNALEEALKINVTNNDAKQVTAATIPDSKNGFMTTFPPLKYKNL